MIMEIKQFNKYKATVKLRRNDKYRVKPEAEALDNKEFIFKAIFPLDCEGDPDIYAGEWAMELPMEIILHVKIPWVASGDLINIEEINRPENS